MSVFESILRDCGPRRLPIYFLALLATFGLAHKIEARGSSPVAIDRRASLSGQRRNSRARAFSGSELVKRAIDSMGGEVRLRSLKSLSIEAIGHMNLLEQSERPAGPWVLMYEQITELRDLERLGMRRTVSSRSFVVGVFAIHNGAGRWREIIEAIAKASATEPAKN